MPIHAETDDMRGNIVFFYSYGQSLIERFLTRLVQWGTHGPFVHCEIICGKTKTGQWQTIGAHANGISYGELSFDHTQYIITTIQTVNTDQQRKVIPLNETRVANALIWAEIHQKMAYGWIDNVDQGIDLLFPNNPFQLVQVDHFNCSNFVAAFLDKAGIALPRSFTYPFNVSPNDLAEWFGLLPERKRIRQ